MSVTVNALPIVTAPTQVCIGSTATLSPTTNGTWTSSNTAIATVTNAGVITGISAGTATFTYIQTATGCSKTTLSVTVNALPTGSASNQTICNARTSSVALNSTISGTTFTWTAGLITTPTGGTITGFSGCPGACGTSIAQTLTNTGTTAGAVRYTVTPTANSCSGSTFTVDITVNPKPIITLSNVLAQCSATLTAPTYTDACGVTVTGTTGDTTSYNTQGTYTVVWSFAFGTVITSTQNIIIDDTIAPVASITALPTLSYSGCQITSLPIPTALDNCIGIINGIPNITFPFTTQGATVVTWTYNDGNGNTSIQTQNITLTAPPISGGNLLGYITSLSPAAIPSDNVAITSCPGTITPVTINLSSQIGTIVRWEKFEAGATNWSIIPNTTTSYNVNFDFNNTKSTLFRVLIQVGDCTQYSNMINVHAIPPNVPPILDQSLFNICLNDPVSLVARSGYISTVKVGEGGDFNSGQFPDKWDPTQWRIDGQTAGAQWTASGNNTKFNNWSGTNNHPVGTLYEIEYDSNNLKFGIAHGNYNSAGYITKFGVGPTTLETPIFSLVGLGTAAVAFDQAYNLHSGDIAKLELSLDGGLTYTIVLQDLIGTSPHALSWGDSHGIPVTYPYLAPVSNNSTTTKFNFSNDNSSFDISDYIGNNNVRVKWTFFGTTDESAWAIDNITIPIRPYSDAVEWTDGLGSPGQYIIRDKLDVTYNFVPTAPGVHQYGATALVNGCRAYDPAGTAIATVKVNYAYAGQAQAYTNAECGERTVNLNAYDNTKSANTNNDNGAYPTLVRNNFSDDPGTGTTGKWSVFSASNSCGTYSFSNDTSPTSSFSGDAGVYTLRWKLNGSPCYSDVQVTLTSCQVVDFDGVNDYVTFKDNYGLDNTLLNTFSIEVWVKPDPQPAGAPSNIQTIISKRNANSLINGYDIRLVGSALSFNWNNGSQITSPFPLTTNRWYHVAVTFSGGIYRLYVDGIEVINAAGSAPITNTFACIVGAMDQTGNPPNKPVNYFSGWIDELRIWGVGLSPDHVRQMMNQQIISNGTAVRGEIIPININGPDVNLDGIDDQPLLWANLNGYYRMDQIVCGYLKPYGGKGVDGQLRNITSAQEQTAPLPYTSIRDGNWMDKGIGTTPWKYGDSVWDYPNSTGYNGTPIDWNIVQTGHNINSGNKDITVLGLISTANKLTIADPIVTTPIEKNDGQGLWITHYLKLNGNIDLVGESQLLEKRYTSTQFSESILDVTSTGYIERDQQGKKNSFNYNYWSSPVSNIQGVINNTPYSPSSALRDGTNSANPLAITFGDGAYFADGALSNPIKISNRWIWSYNSKTLETNTDWQDYFQWNYIGNTGLLKTGEGFTMKGTGGIAPITSTQNYVFVGKPNNGTIALPLPFDQTYLVGNPYPSALDANEFILDNLAGRAGVNVFNGALYFWDHFGLSNDHILALYQGGYATYTLVGGVKAINDSSLNLHDGARGSITPQQYVPVGQGFFVDAYLDPAISGTTATVTGGTINFKNSQRIFKREDANPATAASSVFMKKRGAPKGSADVKPKIRLGFDSSIGAHRQLLVGADRNTTNLFDIGYDAPMFDTNENDMFWEISDSQFVIQGVPDFNVNQVLPLGIVIANEGEVTIKIDELENVSSNTNIYLHDTLTGIYHDLKTSDFKIALAEGEYNKRFSLRFESQTKTLDVAENDSSDGIVVLYSNNYKTLIIRNNILDSTVNTVSLYNMIGQSINKWDVEDKEQTNIQIPIKNMPSGIYIVKVKTSKGESSKKIIIK
ncbi:LamG-like jellyroll fold domain-containing protein [Flavobacterium soyangense]|uniref:LamG-like jellyroll fold domain-containing protein n=1 Tax=Flavobacterium soyangense TaxID=2023265 RepID=UPI001E41E560|nr:LamG-like jellyroll fold domain-containing protein [Flavobacterium soyangense]